MIAGEERKIHFFAMDLPHSDACLVQAYPADQRSLLRKSQRRLSYYLLADRFGRAGKGSDKGKVEGLVGYARRNFIVPIPRAVSFAELNAHLLECCLRRLNDRLRGHDDTIGERPLRDREALLPLPPAPYDACEKKPAWVSSLSLVRYRGNDYSVPTAYGHREVLVRGYIHEVVSGTGKTHVALGLGLAACQKGLSVRLHRCRCTAE